MIDHKKCKGNGVARGHGCGMLVPVSLYGRSNRKYGLGISCKCYSKWIRETPEGKTVLEKATLKAVSPRIKAEQGLEKAREERKGRNSLELLKVNVRTVCHTYIKLRDKHKPCISCGMPWHSDFHAGHYYKAELYSSLKYNELNINGQCPKCNIREEGNLSLYAVNLPKRIGEGSFAILNEKASIDKQLDFKWDRSTLNEIRKYYQQKTKELCQQQV